MGWHDWLPVLAAPATAALIVVALIMTFAGATDYNRPLLIEGITESIFWLAAATIGAAATISALMLTTLGLLQHFETRTMRPRFLFHMRLTVVAALWGIVLAILTLLVTIFPSAGTEQFTPAEWQVELIYYALIGLTALMIGAFILMLLSLYATISELFANLPKDWIEDILADDSEEGMAEEIVDEIVEAINDK